ncbi:MAG: hypothetical protein HY832_03770 [Candidatus Aenigmarchaeota archaeon]|nr:hypothetical protein [Candidatus Aenigmarchaeota archaeon]
MLNRYDPLRSYASPFDPTAPLRIMQGNNSPWSHKKHEGIRHDLSNAIDFAVPFGTGVYATHGGSVYRAFDRQTRCYRGEDPNIGLVLTPNFILVMDKDDALTFYAHLAYLGNTVVKGDSINSEPPPSKLGGF